MSGAGWCTVGEGRAMHNRLFRRLGEIRYWHFSATLAAGMRAAWFSREALFNVTFNDSRVVYFFLLMNIYGGRIEGISRLPTLDTLVDSIEILKLAISTGGFFFVAIEF